MRSYNAKAVELDFADARFDLKARLRKMGIEEFYDLERYFDRISIDLQSLRGEDEVVPYLSWLIAIENIFGISISDNEALNVKTFDELYMLVERKIDAKYFGILRSL